MPREIVKSGSCYRTGAVASTDIHGGDHLFYNVYRSYLKFSTDRMVTYWRELIDNSGTFNEKDARAFEEAEKVRFATSDHGYIIFNTSKTKFTGRACNNIDDHLVFNMHHITSGMSSGLVFKLCD